MFFGEVGGVLAAKRREGFRDGVYESDWSVGLRHVVRCFADFTQNQGYRFEPSGVINFQFENGSEDEK